MRPEVEPGGIHLTGVVSTDFEMTVVLALEWLAFRQPRG